jgi:tRNA C32,U32 (ribose-2'-O)-methylase TrmJ
MESCSMLVTIPSPGGFESLNVGVTAGIMLCAASPAAASNEPAGRPADPDYDESGAEDL